MLCAQILLDGFSDPRHESKYSAHDVITLGFITSPQHSELLKSTKSINKGEVNGRRPLNVIREAVNRNSHARHCCLQ